MSRAPPIPKRDFRNRALIQKELAPQGHVGGSGFQVARSLQPDGSTGSLNNHDMHMGKVEKKKQIHVEEEDDEIDIQPFISDLHEVADMTPDVIIGEDVEIKGDFQYDGLLHLCGRFEGRLITEGDVYVGPKAVLKANITTVNRLLIDGGHVVGNIAVKQVGVTGKAIIRGELTCRYLEVNSDDCILDANVYIHPDAPNVVEFPRERLQQSPSSHSSVSHAAEPSPVAKEVTPTAEVSIQALLPSASQQLTPAEQALQAKVEAKERRKEAKKHQQEEALRQAHGLSASDASPEHSVSFSAAGAAEQPEQPTEAPVSPAKTVSASPSKDKLTKQPNTDSHSDIKLVSGPVTTKDVVPSSPEHAAAAPVPALNLAEQLPAAETAETAEGQSPRALEVTGAWENDSDVGDIRSEAGGSPRKEAGSATSTMMTAASIAEEGHYEEGGVLPPTQDQRDEAVRRDSAPSSPQKGGDGEHHPHEEQHVNNTPSMAALEPGTAENTAPVVQETDQQPSVATTETNEAF